MKLQRLFTRLTALALPLSLAACGGQKNAFTTMRLVKTEGAAQASDEEGKSVRLISNLGLYSGYGASTLTESYGWILLDAAKLAKLDAASAVEVQKSGKQLELYVRSGGNASITAADFDAEAAPEFVQAELEAGSAPPSPGPGDPGGDDPVPPNGDDPVPTPGEPWQAAYISPLDLIRTSAPTADIPEVKGYHLCDIDKNGIPEMIVSYYETFSYYDGTKVQAYSYENGGTVAFPDATGTDALDLSYGDFYTLPGENDVLLRGEMWRGVFPLYHMRLQDGQLTVEELGSFDGNGLLGPEHDKHNYAPGAEYIAFAPLDDYDPILNYAAP